VDIYTIDLNFQGIPKTIACYLLDGPDGYVLVETGPGSTLPTLLAWLAKKGLTPNDIKHVLVTHIHLDHSGAAGWWANQGAQVYVHHVGAQHLIDPRRLLASASLIYGSQMQPLWGEITPAPAERITPLYDGDKVEVAGIALTALDTPGHAYHHHVYVLDTIAFTGDAAGVRILDTGLVDVPAPPPEFNLDVWQTTIARLLNHSFEAIYPTHFGKLIEWRNQLESLSDLLETAAYFVKRRLDRGLDREIILGDYKEWRRGRALEVGMPSEDLDRCELANPHHMSVDGITRYWRKQAERNG
jgi:glyoxylase-like metal-dependent hydrolase (beta-lactamase superfamily II)